MLAAAGLNWADTLILLAGLGALLVVGYFAGRQERDTRDFFLGRRGLPAWAVCLSFIATEISAVTIIAVPAESYRANWYYLQMFIGSAAARVAIAFLFIPVFYKFDCTTIYEFLRHRFGPATHYTATMLFFVTRLLGSGVRLYAAAMGTALILGWAGGSSSASAFGENTVQIDDKRGLMLAIAMFTIVAIAFIAFGGIKAVIWNNVVQAIVFIVGGVVTVIYLYGQIDGGATTIVQTARDSGRLAVLNLSLDSTDSKTLLLLVLNGFFTSLAAFGTDQDLMQRLLTVDTRRSSQRSLLATIVIGLPTVMLFLSIGTLLFVYYHQHPSAARPANSDQILPFFITHVMPHALKGLLLLTIIMASIDSPLGSLATSFVTDIYRPLIRRDAADRHYLLVSRISVAVFGVLLGVLAFTASYLSNVLWVAFQVLSVTGGSLLGIFLLGLLTKRAGDRGNASAMIGSALAMGLLMAAIQLKWISLGWTWLIVIGTALTMMVGYLLGHPPGSRPPKAGIPVIATPGPGAAPLNRGTRP